MYLYDISLAAAHCNTHVCDVSVDLCIHAMGTFPLILCDMSVTYVCRVCCFIYMVLCRLFIVCDMSVGVTHCNI